MKKLLLLLFLLLKFPWDFIFVFVKTFRHIKLLKQSKLELKFWWQFWYVLKEFFLEMIYGWVEKFKLLEESRKFGRGFAKIKYLRSLLVLFQKNLNKVVDLKFKHSKKVKIWSLIITAADVNLEQLDGVVSLILELFMRVILIRIRLNIYVFFPIYTWLDKHTPILNIWFLFKTDYREEDDYTLMCYEWIQKIVVSNINNNLTDLDPLELSCTKIADNVIWLREEIRLTPYNGLITMSKGPVVSEDSYISVLEYLKDQSKIRNEFFVLNGPMHNEAGFSWFKDIPDVENFLDILLSVWDAIFDNETKMENLYGITENLYFYKREITVGISVLRFLTELYAKAWIKLLKLDQHHDSTDVHNNKIRVHNRLLWNHILYNASRAAASLDSISKFFIICFLTITLTILLFKIVKCWFKKIISEWYF
jgi:hypothetical protein